MFSSAGNGDFLTFTNGLLTDMLVNFIPPNPILPALSISFDPEFFTVFAIEPNTGCVDGAVCGTLDASTSAPRLALAVPEPASAALLLAALALLGASRRRPGVSGGAA